MMQRRTNHDRFSRLGHNNMNVPYQQTDH